MTMPAPTFLFDANHPALDFINTVRLENGRPSDQLTTTDDLISWLAQANLVSENQAKRCMAHAPSPAVGEQLLEEAKRLRTCIRRTVEQVEGGQGMVEEDAVFLNHLLQRRTGRPVLLGTSFPLERQMQYDLLEPVHLLGVLADQAADLLSRDVGKRLKKCGHPACMRHYLDVSKNQIRRWCSMESCGNRSKANAYYQRKRGADKLSGKRQH